jgi:hypothetical protein
MRFLMMVKANKDSEASVMPGEALLSEMAKFNEEMVKAGIMVDGAGLQASSKGARIHISGDKRTVEKGPFGGKPQDLIAGYWIINVGSLEDAIGWAKRVPNPTGEEGVIELRRFFELEDFAPSAAVDEHKKLAETLAKTKA